MKTINYQEIIKLYQKGVNISSFLKEKYDFLTQEDIIEISYDMQAGSYIDKITKDNARTKYRENNANELFNIIKNLHSGDKISILEAGIGEANNLALLLKLLKNKYDVDSYGFDISLSRLLYAKSFLNKHNLQVSLFTSILSEIAINDSSIDFVITFHSIEPNKDIELEIIKELYRITKKYLILIEPDYETANNEYKKRIEKFGYVQNIRGAIKELNLNLIEDRLFVEPPIYDNSRESRLFIIKKDETNPNKPKLICPKTKNILFKNNDNYLSSNFFIYPCIETIPCLRKKNAIIATKISKDITNEFKNNQ